MNCTFATVIVPASAKASAQAAMPGFFEAGFSATGEAPASHFISSGHFMCHELDMIVNDVAWTRVVRFGPLEEALADLGLKPVQEPLGA